jgi:integrase/recombinase XerD
MSKITIYNRACNQVVGFRAMSEEFMHKLVIEGKSRSTHQNYLRQMAKLSLHCDAIPLDLELAELEEYLYLLIERDTESKSSFKHLVYGLRKLYQLFDKPALELALPSMSKPQKLPVILSSDEVKRILKVSATLANKVMFGLIYDTGLRITELVNLRIGDVDLDREQLHVRQSKNKKDRYMVISSHAGRGIGKHLALNNPNQYLFESPNRKGMPIGKTRIRRLLKEAVQLAGINKHVCVHTLRHTFATHQLEAGQDIMTLKALLGHSHINTTMMYLHTARLDSVKRCGCLQILYGE